MNLQRFNLIDQLFQGWSELDDLLLDDLLNLNRLDKTLYLIRTFSSSEDYQIQNLFTRAYHWTFVENLYPTTLVAHSTLAIKRVLKSIKIRDEGKMFDFTSPETQAARLKLLKSTLPYGEYREEYNLKHFLTEAAGSFFLQPAGEKTWVVDLRDLEQYEVREAFETYGGKLTLTETEGEPEIKIEYLGKSYTPDDPGYDRIEYIFRASLCLKIILEYHAVFCHLVDSQFLAYDFLPRVMEEDSEIQSKLSPRAKLFLSLTLHRTLDINSKIVILAGKKGSLFHRGFGLTLEAQKRYMQDIVRKYQGKSPDQIKKFLLGGSQADITRKNTKGGEINQEKSPEVEGSSGSRIGVTYHRQAKRFYHLCSEFIKNAFPESEFQTRWTNHLFVATFFHELMGDQQLFNIGGNNFLPSRVRKDNYRMDTERQMEALATATVAVSTRVPLLKDRVVTDFLEEDSELLGYWNEFTDKVYQKFGKSKFINVRNLEVSVGY